MPQDTTTQEETKKEEEGVLVTELTAKFQKAETAQREVRVGGFSWDDRERLFFGKYKHPLEKTKSVLSTGELSTIAIDGSCRVMAQLPTGRFYNFNGNTGSNMAMNLLFEHYVIPNASIGGHLLTKLRMVNMYARVFPVIPVFIPWEVSEKYTGPDMIIIHPRRFFPQPGKNSIEDMDWCFIETEVSRDWLKSRDKDVWMNIDEVIGDSTEGTGTPDIERSVNERGKTKTGITLRHYLTSKGDWVVIAVSADLIILNEKAWFTGIPIEVKGQYPVIDSIYAYNDFDRGEGTQKTIDSSLRLFLEGMAMTIKPPKMVDSKKAVVSSIIMAPDAMWFGEAGSVQMQDVSPKGMNMVQGLWGMLKGNLLSMGASQDTSVPMGVDSSMGKTPEAIRAQGDKQGARDAWDSFTQDRFIERVFTKMADMIAKKGVQPFAFQLLGESLKKIKEQYPDSNFDTLFNVNQETGGLTVDNEKLVGQYRYLVDPGSTGMKKDETGAKMMGVVDTYFKYPQIAQDFATSGKRFDTGEAFKRFVIDQGIQDSDKIIVDNKNPESVAGVGSDGATMTPPGADGTHPSVPVTPQGAPGQPPAIDPSTGQPIAPQVQQMSELEQLKQTVAQMVPVIQQLMKQSQTRPTGKSPSESMSYKDVPEDVKRQMESAAGFQPSQIGSQPVSAVATPIDPNTGKPISQPINSPVITQ